MIKNFTPLVSIVIPVYNGSNYVREAIDSALSQTYKNIEIIVINDGSTDNTEEIIKSYKDQRIRYYKKENGGVATALNLGIQKMKGDYFSWLSHDDMYYPDKIEKQIAALRKLSKEKRDKTILYGNYYVIDLFNNNSHEYVMHPLSDEYRYSKLFNLKLLFKADLHGCTLLIPKKCFEEVGYFDPKLRTTQDYDLWFKFVNYGYRFRYMNKKLISTRRHTNQDTFDKVELCKKEIEGLYLNAFILFKSDILNQDDKEYNQFLKYIEAKNSTKLLKIMKKEIDKHFLFHNLQVGDNDLIGNKFNGHDLHKYLRERSIDSTHLVWNKESNDKNTYLIAGEKTDRSLIKQNALDIQKRYTLNSISNPIVYDILYNRLFLNADVIHFHLIHNFIFDIQLLPIMSRLRPIVWTLHDPWSTSGHCIENFDCEKWRTSCGDCPYLSVNFPLDKDNTALNYEIKKEAITNSKLEIIVASEWMKNRVGSSEMFKNTKINVIPFGINQEIFKPIDKVIVRKKIIVPADSFVISFRGDSNSKKGLDYIEYLIDKIKTDKKIYFLIVGGDYENKSIIKHSKHKYIEYGWVKNDYLMSDIYNASDLFLMPSIVESFGMMAIEAMSCGVLPIVLEGTALPSTVNAPDCGVAVKRDKEEYLKTVQYYIDNDKERELRAKKCLEFARKNYNKDIYLDNIIKVYKEAIKNHKMSKNDKYLLDQLKKNMMVEPQRCVVDSQNSTTFLLKDILYKTVSNNLKKKVKDHILIYFYKIDKLIPKGIRKVMKTKLVKFNFVKKYLIKSD